MSLTSGRVQVRIRCKSSLIKGFRYFSHLSTDYYRCFTVRYHGNSENTATHHHTGGPGKGGDIKAVTVR